MTRHSNFSRKQKAEIARLARYCCAICTVRALPGEADHILPVELGGESIISNGRWLCVRCHKVKTAGDVWRIRKADRVRDTFTGAMPPSRRPMPFGRRSKFKRKISGEIVER